MQRMQTLIFLCLTVCVALGPENSAAHEFIISYGGGEQRGSDQSHSGFGVDYSFLKIEKSQDQHRLIGISYTRIESDTDQSNEMTAISIYPQISLYAKRRPFGQPFFFVRALGPTYISTNRLGDRKQKNHFAFLAQVGVGVYFRSNSRQQMMVMLSYKHFSNANIFKDNDGIDLPLVISLGAKF